ncbi:hypothetical protein HNR73_001593 [Phytomonospora endophytica]|uniref:Uncharacterized protein n=1 Tax=Phytomonospora endophytica TaxID=714109 RepID=A0A841FFG4_9ACTN|nr:hypothetical protein [Phytomonospora endophytica]
MTHSLPAGLDDDVTQTRAGHGPKTLITDAHESLGQAVTVVSGGT